MWVLGTLLGLAIMIAPWWAILTVARQRRELRAMRERLDALERRLDSGTAEPIAAPTPSPVVVPAAEVVAAPPPRPEPVPPPALASLAPPAPVPATTATTARGFESSGIEELVGSVWLQNVGAVLLLLGVFFLILWGYTTGRIGPGVLVGAGVALGAAVIWRGDRMARRLPLFGHALIGIGLGIAYLSLYLGHFTLHVLPVAAAFALLAALSIAAVGVGLRYRVQTIAALGVLGAFVPQLMAAWIPLHGFSMTPGGLFAYMAAIDVVVFVLAARAGWSTLALAALLISSVTWIVNVRPSAWGWNLAPALAALFTGLGLSPLPRLVRREGTIAPVDLVLIAVAPLCLIACSWPLLAGTERVPAAILLLALALVHLLAALWVDRRRDTQELWRPLTGAAVLFVTFALERLLGRTYTPMAWTVEGAILVWIGLRPRGGWLRLCGSIVTAVGATWVLGGFFAPGVWEAGDRPVVYAAGLRDLVCVAAVLAGAALLSRARDRLAEPERWLPELWTAAGNLLLAIWLGREANHVAISFEGDGGLWTSARARAAALRDDRQSSLMFALTGAAWLAQAAVLLAGGVRASRLFLRASGSVLAMFAAFTVFIGIVAADGWSNDRPPVVHVVGLLQAAGIACLFVIAARLSRTRERFGRNERNMPEVWTVVAGLLLLGWIGQEADHLARWLEGVPGRSVRHAMQLVPAVRTEVGIKTAVFTSAGWLLQAIGLLAAGWIRGSAFLRWLGLGLFGVTVLKVLIADLRTVDVFWRFLSALVVGAALLAVSYAYQRRTRAERKAA
jgi:uncharacterized membrane protein